MRVDLRLVAAAWVEGPDVAEVINRAIGPMPVSYTHLDVYKRQGLFFAPEDGAPLGAMMYVHMVLGLLILGGAVFLYVIARRQPIIVTNVDGTPRSA